METGTGFCFATLCVLNADTVGQNSCLVICNEILNKFFHSKICLGFITDRYIHTSIQSQLHLLIVTHLVKVQYNNSISISSFHSLHILWHLQAGKSIRVNSETRRQSYFHNCHVTFISFPSNKPRIKMNDYNFSWKFLTYS